MIVGQGISKRFGKLEVLNHVDFTISKPGVYAILGPNGSGKTTMLKIILGMVLAQSGKVEFHINGKSYSSYRDKIGYLPQIARFPENLKVQELISMINDVRNQNANPDELIELFGLGQYLNQKLGNLSGGTRQKVNLILALMFDSPVLILDEPTAGLDPISLIRMKDLIREEKSKGKIILITTHILPLVQELADEVFFLLDGRIRFNGTIRNLMEKTGQEDLEHAVAELLAK